MRIPDFLLPLLLSSSSAFHLIPRLAVHQHRIPLYSTVSDQLPSRPVLDAVRQSAGRPLVASDLAASAGISLSQARKELTSLAALTQGGLAVSSEGDLLYSFPANLDATLQANSAKFRASLFWRNQLLPPLQYAVKVGFGLVLFASLLAIFTTIFVLVNTSSSTSSQEDDRRQSRRGGIDFFWGPSPLDLFYFRPNYSRYSLGNTNSIGSYSSSTTQPEMGLLEAVFSYVLGDGDPNQDWEQRRLAQVVDTIRSNGGAVTAEELAPYCEEVPLPQTHATILVEESFVLPLVTQLDGEPRVTEDGNIVYVFPELMRTSVADSLSVEEARRERRILKRAGLAEEASIRSIRDVLTRKGVSTRGALERGDLVDLVEKFVSPIDEEDPSMLVEEREHQFSLASPFQTVLAGLLGVVNLGGALYLGNLLAKFALYGVRLPSYMGVVQQFYPLLLGYALFFNIAPLSRSVWIQRKNEQIRQRNQRRKLWKALLDKPVGNLKQKLLAATRMKKTMKQLDWEGKDIVFDTKKDIIEMEESKQRDSLSNFDKRLEQIETNAWE